MRKQTLTKAILAAMTGVAVMSACVDDKYDLSNLDTTIEVGSSSLKLPKCSTGDIVLDNLFNLKDDSPIKKVNGLYYLDKDGEASPDPIHVAQINIKKPDDEEIHASMDLSDIFGVKAMSPRKEPSVNSTYRYDISDLAKAQISKAKATDISPDVVNLKRISFNSTTMNLVITITGENKEIIKKLHFDNLALQLPKGLELTSCKYLGKEKLGTPELREKAKTEGIVILVEGNDEEGYRLSGDDGPLSFEISLNAANVGDNLGLSFDSNNHSAELKGQFQITGYAELNTDEDIDYDILKDKFMTIVDQMSMTEKLEALERLNNGDYSQAIDALLPKTLNFDGTCKFTKDLTVQTFSGSLQHPIDNIDDIKLENLPDFLDKPGVVLDLQNPQLYLDFYTSLQTQLTTDIALVPWKDGSKINDGVYTTLTYDGSTGLHKVFMLAPHTDPALYPDTYKNYTKEEQTAEVGNLIRTIPDIIKVKGQNSEQIMVKLPNCENIQIGTDYIVELHYRVFSPLTFGPDFQIVYSDTEMDMDLGDDLDDLKVGSLELTGVATSDIPLALNLTVTPLTKVINGKSEDLSKKGLLIEYNYKKADGQETGFQKNGVQIRANAKGEEQDRFTIRISASEGHTLNEFLHSGALQLDGIEYEAKLNTPDPNADALRTDAKVTLKDIQVTAVGVSYLANEDK